MKLFGWSTSKHSREIILGLALFCVALVVHEIFGSNGYLAMRQKRREYEALQQQIQKLQVENQQLEEKIKALKTDPKAIEKIAREQMGLARPGELIYTLPDSKKKGSAGSVAGTKDQAEPHR